MGESCFLCWNAVIFGMSSYILYKTFYSFYSRRCMARNLRDKVVCITGASSGIGRELAAQCFALGAKIIIVARRRELLEELKRELLESRDGDGKDGDIEIVEADLGKLDEVESKGREMVDCYGKVDCLINNAGTGCRGSVKDTVIDVHRNVMTVNYFSHVALTKTLLPQMMASKEKSWIVGISSLQGKIALPFRSAYAASKHANQAFYDSLRAEVESVNKNISVCLTSPGYVKTNISLRGLTSTGEVFGAKDPRIENGMSVKECARRIIEAMVTNQKDVCIAPWYHSSIRYVRTLFPNVYFTAMKLRAKSSKEVTHAHSS